MSIPSVYETELFTGQPVNGHTGMQSQQQRSGIVSAFTRHKLLVFFTLICGLGFGYLYFLRTPVLYQSSTRIRIIQQQVPMNHTSTGMRQENEMSTQLEIVTSPILIERIFESEEVADVVSAESTGGLTTDQVDSGTDFSENEQTVASNTGAQESSAEVNSAVSDFSKRPTFYGVDDPVRLVAANMSASPVNDDIFELSFTGPDPADCKDILSSVVKAYESFILNEYATNQEQLITKLEEAEREFGDKVIARRNAYNEFVLGTDLIDLGNGLVNPHAQRVQLIYQEIAAIEREIDDIEASIAALQHFLTEESDPRALELLLTDLPIDDFAAEAAAKKRERENLQSEIDNLEFDDRQLAVQYGPEHPNRQRLRATIEFKKEQLRVLEAYESTPLDERVTVWLAALNSRKIAAESRHNSLEEERRFQSQEAAKLQAIENEDADLLAAIARAEEMYQTILGRLDESDLFDDLQSVRIQVLDEPQRGEQIQPIFSTIMTMAGAMGIMVGLMIGYLLELADASFRTPDEIRSHLKLPVLGHIPLFPDRVKLKNTDSKLDKHLWCHHRPGGSIAEAFKGVRTWIQFNRSDEVHQVIMLTSPSPGEGKSTVLSNLAVSLAHLGKRVLVVDADLRRSMQPRNFGLCEAPGLTDILQDDVEPFDVIQQTEVLGLSVLAGGKRVRNPSEVLSSPKMAALITLLREKFDYVLIDTPPVLVVTDPLTIAPLSDTVIAVLKLSGRSRREAAATIERIKDVGGEILGVVVNGLETSVGSGTGYGYRGYQYTYGYGYGYGRYYSQHGENGIPGEEEPRRITAS